jgi:Right handed beta helix region
MKHWIERSGLLVVLVLAAGVAQAQATRTWVSGVGDDANPCSRTAPCKTFAGAISKTAAGGEIDALDPAGFGQVTVTKAITIDGGAGQVAGIVTAGGNGITINAGVNDIVTLRNLRLFNVGSSSGNGIVLLNARSLHIENCTIASFAGNGINIVPNAAAQVFIDDSVSRGNTGDGLHVVAAGSNAVRVSVANSHFSDNANGIFSGDFSKMTVRNSDTNGNTGSGLVALGLAGATTVNLVNSTTANNIGYGVIAGGSGALPSQIRMSNVSTATNGVGLATGVNGSILSFGNNYNPGSGAPTGTIAPQ